ncbi:hemin ABC transporter substrate-binding protein [Rhizobium wenxiniae]|uniref:Iron complex transport system substrate-binding protein n=1 Tax=Rhizobium wenxiniae TaxID=1737357 RepID=A0A7X0CYI5_9HYPH|nr:ABC transporter substrate-binding protein [Rhizobium wenxiniae]MBB6161322.1 iron complex transport system substrate-binding protein [Rhizobium wenxiniae]GGF88004.1 hemin ABC transporter substrate-binding protein [Rhizobium wenxiniae]
MVSCSKFGRLLAAILVGSTLSSGGVLAADKGNPEAKRIVSVGGTITEILYDLGAQDRIVARDSTSFYPADANSKPDVGYMRQLSAEGILGQKPDLILMEEGSGPPPVLEILKASEVPMVLIPTPPKADKIGQKIRDVGAAVGLSDKAEVLAAKTEDGLRAVAADVAKISGGKKKVLFVLSISNGRLMAGGADTEAGAIIEMAGGVNAAPTINGYKPLSDEAVIAAAPDVILSMSRGDHSITPEQMFALPSMQTTPAAANKALVSMDGLVLLGFGPRTPEAARALAAKIYPGAIN